MIAQLDRDFMRMRPRKALARLISYAFVEGRPLTTSGRWINPIVFAGYRLAMLLPAPRAVRAPIFIVGSGRSGTTLLGRLLAMHRDVAFLNEPKALWHFAHGAEDLIGSYDRDGAGRIRLGSPPARTGRRVARIYAWALAWAGAGRIVDKYPEMIFRTDFLRATFPDAHLVAILRDGVESCGSIAAWSARKGVAEAGEVHDWWGRDALKWQRIVAELVPEHADLAPLRGLLEATVDHHDRAAVEWIVTTRETLRGGVDVIRHDALCADPVGVVDTLCAACDLAPDAVMADYACRVVTTPSPGGSVALAPALVRPFCDTLRCAGFEASIPHVHARAE